MEALNQMHEQFTTKSSNPDDWLLVSNPTPVLAIAVVYIISVKYVGPSIMKDRKPYSLKNVIFVYNIVQIFWCMFIMYKGLEVDKYFTIGVQCVKDQKNHSKVSEFYHYLLFLKMFELIETLFFVLRKKQQQVSNLHVYHHTSTMVLVWAAVTRITEQAGVFYSCLNCAVHVIMYAYYTAATSQNPKVLEVARKLKKYLTLIQMIQFTIIICHSMYQVYFAVSSGCRVWRSNVGVVVLLSDVIFVFYMFYQFYQKSYVKKSS